jgi:ATP dependent DNA ligase domain
MGEPLASRRALLEKRILPKLHDPVRYSLELKASLPDLITSVKAQGLEGLVAKKRSGVYEPGQRSGSWQKIWVSQGQEFVRSEATRRATGISTHSLLDTTKKENCFTPVERAMVSHPHYGRSL